MGSTQDKAFWFGWFYVVNRCFIVWVQDARCEVYDGCKILAKTCNLVSLGTLAWMGGCFRLGESQGLCMLIFCLLPRKCFHSFVVSMSFSVCLVYICLCAVSWYKKMLIVISGFSLIYNYIFLVIIFNFYYWQCFFFVRNRRKYILRCFPEQEN